MNMRTSYSLTTVLMILALTLNIGKCSITILPREELPQQLRDLGCFVSDSQNALEPGFVPHVKKTVTCGRDLMGQIFQFSACFETCTDPVTLHDYSPEFYEQVPVMKFIHLFNNHDNSTIKVGLPLACKCVARIIIPPFVSE